MKREDVKNKITGITEEQPNWLMQENGSDITREKFLSTLSLRRATGGKQSFIRMDRIFLSTLSLRRATGLAGKVEDAINISIHALLAESDRGAGADRGGPVPHFYPRSPCGERHYRLLPTNKTHYFYPRSPCGERPLSPR